MFNDFCVYLDAGHGALDKNGKYVTAPSKQFQHSKGSFHDGRWFYEGVFNRTITNRVALKFDRLGINYMMVSHEWVDTPLQYRVDMANWYHRNALKGIYISNHANAANGVARGFEVYTSPGKTKSDDLAQLMWNQVSNLLGTRITMRSDLSDGDHDREANFFVLTRTAMPAMLVEHLFFDNYEDAMLLMSDEIVDYFAEAQVRAVIEFFKTM